MKITSHVAQVGGAEDSDPADAAIYLIAQGGEAALVDAGTGRGTHRVLANLRRAGVEPRSVKQLFLTHCHYDTRAAPRCCARRRAPSSWPTRSTRSSSRRATRR
jgi:hypothetical protein